MWCVCVCARAQERNLVEECGVYAELIGEDVWQRIQLQLMAVYVPCQVAPSGGGNTPSNNMLW